MKGILPKPQYEPQHNAINMLRRHGSEPHMLVIDTRKLEMAARE
jgi:hypothetical protein